jgi:hypothetical protein
MAANKEPDIEGRALALAHQLGRLIGTVERKTEGWLDSEALTKQVVQIRDSANELLDHLAGAIASGRDESAAEPSSPKASRVSRSGGTVDAPGKSHRKRTVSARGVKHSDQTISKIKGAKTMRRGNRRG